jgi:site-specific recombinase XerD
MHPSVAVTEFLFAHEHAEKTRRWYAGMLGTFVTFCVEQGITTIGEVSAPLVRHFFNAVRARHDPRYDVPVSSATVHGYARAVRALLNWCVGEGLLDERVPKRIAMPRQEQKVVQALSPQQVERLLGAAQTSRDKAIIAVLVDTGLRANELCTLTLDHVRVTPQDAWLLVKGKRGKWREVGLGKRSRRLLHTYIHRERLATCAPLVPHTLSDMPYVFVGRRGPLTPSGLDQLLYRLRDEAGAEHFTGVRVSAHTLRHTFATLYLAGGGDVYKLSRLMGHSSVTVTEQYLRSFRAKDARQGKSVLDNIA